MLRAASISITSNYPGRRVQIGQPGVQKIPIRIVRTTGLETPSRGLKVNYNKMRRDIRIETSGVIRVKNRPLILKFAEKVKENSQTTEYDGTLNLNVVYEDGVKKPFCVSKEYLWAQETKTCKVVERDD